MFKIKFYVKSFSAIADRVTFNSNPLAVIVLDGIESEEAAEEAIKDACADGLWQPQSCGGSTFIPPQSIVGVECASECAEAEQWNMGMKIMAVQ